MGRLVPVFEEDNGRMLFKGKFKDLTSEQVGHLETATNTQDSTAPYHATLFVLEKN